MSNLQIPERIARLENTSCQGNNTTVGDIAIPPIKKNKNRRYPDSIIGEAIKRFVNGSKVTEIERDLKISSGLINRWLSKHYFYKKGFIVLTLASKV